MENLIIIYFIKSSLASVFLYGLYIVFFRNDTHNKARRLYLLSIILFSVIYPLCKFEISAESNIVIYEVLLPQVEITPHIIESNIQQLELSSVHIILLIQAIGILVLFLRFVMQLFSIINLRFNNKCESYGKLKIISLMKDITPFSFFNWIFISNKTHTKEELDIMFSHEEVHVIQYHSFDVIVSELFCIVFWCNPIAWLIRRDINVNLEYLADKGVLDKGVEEKKYQYLLLQIIKNSANIQIVNNFNVSQLKKRITMINKEKSSKSILLKYLFVVPVVALLLVGNVQRVFSQPIEGKEVLVENYATDEPSEPFVMVKNMPEFTGGNEALMHYINTNIKYPEESAKEGITGRVIVRFVVTKTGDVKDVVVVRSVNEEMDKEAIRVVGEMPKWIAGEQNGKKVDVYYTLPISYSLKK